MTNAAPFRQTLLVRARRWICALPAASAIEVMRPLPLQPVAGAPPFVRGLSIIRGAALPVVDLATFLGEGLERGARLVVVRAGPRLVAVEVDAVIGFADMDLVATEALPPLLSEALAEHVHKLGALDGHTLALLDTCRLLPGGDLAPASQEGG